MTLLAIVMLLQEEDAKSVIERPRMLCAPLVTSDFAVLKSVPGHSLHAEMNSEMDRLEYNTRRNVLWQDHLCADLGP